MRRMFKKNFSCIDVGCHKGEMLDIMLRLAPEGTHYGFEPIPMMYENLEKKYSDYKNVHIINAAASDHIGETTFQHVVTNPSYSGIKKRDYDRAYEEVQEITVQMQPIDRVIPTDQKIDFIKIDVEGAELQVLQGAQALMKEYKPMVLFEHGLGAADHYNTTPEMIYDYFNACGMSISSLKSLLKGGTYFSREEFHTQFYDRLNYYFVAK